MHWEERRTGQTKFFWHEAFRNKMPWEVNFGRLESRSGHEQENANSRKRVSLGKHISAGNHIYVLPQVECADARRDNNSLSSQSLLLSREHALASLHSIVPFLLWAGKPLWLPAFLLGLFQLAITI